MFNQRSAFDEALSRPLVPSSDEQSATSASSSKKKKKGKSKIGTSGRGSNSPLRSAGAGAAAASAGSGPAAAGSTGRLPSFGPRSGNTNGENYAPPSAVSSVVSEEDANAAQLAASTAMSTPFDPALSSTFETSHADRAPPTQHQQQRMELELEHESLDEALLRERNTALAEVARNMGLVHTIQRELSTLVDAQQEDIDDIEANAAEVHESTERGVEQLERARQFMKDGCGSKWKNAFLVSVGGTATVAAIVFWLLAK